jgi:hypothetical protein
MTNAKLTKAGRQAHQVGLDGIDMDSQLLMEILSRVGGESDMEQLIDLAEELEEQFGSTEGALQALKSGKVSFEVETCPPQSRGKVSR